MSIRLKRVGLIALAACGLLFGLFQLKPEKPAKIAESLSTQISISQSLEPTNREAETTPAKLSHQKIRHKVSEFTSEERTAFESDFAKKYKPAIIRWYQAFGQHMPFNANSITVQSMVERLGVDANFTEYVFVIDGITFAVKDAKGDVRVHYVNDPKQTQKMATLSDGTTPPITRLPISKDEIMAMLEAEGGIRYPSHEIRMTASGLSGNLNGGVIVDVGGKPDVGSSWDYSLVFGSDGLLAYYLKRLE